MDVFGSMIASLDDARDAIVGTIPTRFLAVLPLTAADRKRKIESGVASLLRAWEEQRRDVFTVRPGVA